MKKIVIAAICLVLATILVLLFKNRDRANKAEVTHNMVVQQIEALGRLELVKYTIKDVMEYRKKRQWLPDSKTALIISGEVVGCVDLAKITAADITVVKDSLDLLLPAPEICYHRIDHSRSRVYNIEYGLWESARLVDEAYRQAEQQLLIQAGQMNITDEVRNNAVKLLNPLFGAMGYKAVNIRFKEEPRPEVQRIEVLNDDIIITPLK